MRRRLATALLVWVGCASPPPPLEPPSVPAWDDPAAAGANVEADERELWSEAEKSIAKLAEEELFLENAALTAYVSGVLSALLPQPLPAPAPQPSIRIVRSSERLASVGPSGVVVLSAGLLGTLESEAQLAAVLAHELGHFVLRHPLVTRRFASQSASTVQRMEVSRRQEYAADALGVEWSARAGYEPREALRALELIETDDAPAQVPVPAWRSHPFVKDRLAVLRAEISERRLPSGGREVERYENAVAEVLLVVAQLEIEQGLLDRAKATIDRHLRLRPASGRGYYWKAERLRRVEKEGKRSPAVRAAYEEAVKLAPDDPDALRALGLLLQEVGERPRGDEMLRHYIAVAPEATDRKLIERTLANGVGGVQSIP